MNDRTEAIYAAYIGLAGAIVSRAVTDYRSAYKSVLTGRKTRVSEAATLEKFFRSQWFYLLVDGKITGEYVIREVRKQCGT